MSLLAPVATQVGLQLLLKPYSGVIGAVACTGVGVIYPAYASVKAAEGLVGTPPDRRAACKWLLYWGVWGCLTGVERLLDKLLPWVPYYSTIKLAFLLWLQLPRFEGAVRLYNLARPTLQKAQPHVDDCLNAIYYSLRRPEVAAFTEMLHQCMLRVPGLEWFARGPDGQPAPQRDAAPSIARD